MRIGVDATCWRNNRGFGRFTRELLAAMFRKNTDHEFVVFSDEADAERIFADFDVEVVIPGAKRKVVESATANDRRTVRDVVAFYRAAGGQHLDLLFYPAVYSWFPSPNGIPSVVTFHDAIAEHYPELVFPCMRERIFWNFKTYLAKKKCANILTVSQTAKREIVQYLKIPDDKIDVICEGADAVFRPINDPAIRLDTRKRYELDVKKRLLIYVGGFAPHKNLIRFLNAFERVLATPKASDLQLALVGDLEGGGFHSISGQIYHKIEQTPVFADRVKFTGYVSDSDLAVIYSDALALVLPSLSEGFGLPALEALSCGTPVLGARDGAVMEVAGAAGVPFDPLNITEMASSIVKIASDVEVENNLRSKTAQEAARYSWSKAADQTIVALENCEMRFRCGF